MIEDDLFELIVPVLGRIGARLEVGEEFRSPPLDVLRYHVRRVRLSRIPLLGRALSVTAVVRQPMDVGLAAGGYSEFVKRLSMAINARFPPWPHGPTVGLTVVALTPEPIAPEEESLLQKALVARRSRVVPLGLIRLNLGQEGMSMALTDPPGDLFPEGKALADALTPRFRRFVNLLEDS